MSLFIISNIIFKTESIWNLSNFNFQWTKTLYQKIFEGYKCNNLIYEITLKKMFVWEPENKLQKLQVSQNEILGMTILTVFFKFL